jgi:hypothetical protein
MRKLLLYDLPFDAMNSPFAGTGMQWKAGTLGQVRLIANQPLPDSGQGKARLFLPAG